MAYHGDDTESLLNQWRERKKGDFAAEGHADPVIDTLLKEIALLDDDLHVHTVALAGAEQNVATFSARIRAITLRRAALSSALQARLL